MNILVVHQNFPGQFLHIVTALLARGDKVAAIGGPTAKPRPGVDLRQWKVRKGTTDGIFPNAIRAEADLLRADAALQVAVQLNRDGFVPDVIVAHPGWGETIHLGLVWPNARTILLGEFWYNATESDADFDPEFCAVDMPHKMRVQAKAATQWLAYVGGDRIISPTGHQASTFPKLLQPKIRIIHEGVDMDAARRIENPKFRLPDGRILDRSMPIVTHIGRTLEPLRGFHIFMRALPRLLSERADAQVLIIGNDAPSGYGTSSPGGEGWKKVMLDEVGGRIDMSRVHFIGRIPHRDMIAALSLGRAHVYYTYPFVLSWSLAEAMAAECLIVASDTAPVRDAISHGREGILLPFFDHDLLARQLLEALDKPAQFDGMRRAARVRALSMFDRAAGTAEWLAEIDGMKGC